MPRVSEFGQKAFEDGVVRVISSLLPRLPTAIALIKRAKKNIDPPKDAWIYLASQLI
jgi:hypothetical protein